MNQQDFDDQELQLMCGEIEDDDLIPQDEKEVGDTDHDELKEALQDLADDAKIKEASIEFVMKLREILITHHKEFRLPLAGSTCRRTTAQDWAEAECKAETHTCAQVRASSGLVLGCQDGRHGASMPS
jgi:hypothetical protein